MGRLRVIGVRYINGMVLVLFYISRERLSVILLFRIVGAPVVLDEVSDPRIRAGGVKGRIGQRQDVFILADGKALDLAELWVL